MDDRAGVFYRRRKRERAMRDSSEVPTLLQDLKRALHDVYGENLRGLYLYGSFARQEEDPESDLDVIIVLRDFEDYWEEVHRTGSVISRISLQYEVALSPVRVREREWLKEDAPFLNGVRKECVPV